MKKLKKYIVRPITAVTIVLLLFAFTILSLATFGVCIAQTQDTLKSYTKIINYGKANTEVYKCFIIKTGDVIDTVCEKKLEAQAQRDEDSTMINLKLKIETDYKADIKAFQELQMKIIKEESYLEILNYLIEEKKK